MVTGSNLTFLLTDDSLLESNAADYHLSLLVDRDGLTYAITRKSDSYILEVGDQRFDRESKDDQLGDFLSQWDKNKWNYGAVSLALRAIPSTLIPKGLYDSARAKEIIQLTSPEKPDRIESHQLSAVDAIMVSNFPSAVVETVNRIFPEVQVYPNLLLNLTSVMAKNRFERPLQLYIDMSDSFMELIVAGHKQLLMANYFDIATAEDALYHISNSIKTLSIEAQEIQLYLAGDIELTSDTYKLFKKYFPKLQMNFGFDMPKVAGGLSSLRKQRFMSLLNQYPCVS
ncbi:MAG: DUF3822 family protein [Flavobacteriales bacterium]|nr:DUF3822 family protein [Flavobacteriales bacterium]